jgi:translation initiation factor 1A|uniref:S1-like domain-containing protein n=1 Tax=viral metagenome TaxID=1070528 RepID=A0A6C0K2M7_9ZZZZ
MVKNTGGGKKKKRGARPSTGFKREVIFKEDLQEYGVVDKMLGDMRCSVLCSDATTKVCHIRGKFKRRVWINVGDTVLISLREFEDDKADVVHKYTPEEAEILKIQGEFDPAMYKNLANGDGSSNVQQLLVDTTTLDSEDQINFEAI